MLSVVVSAASGVVSSVIAVVMDVSCAVIIRAARKKPNIRGNETEAKWVKLRSLVTQWISNFGR